MTIARHDQCILALLCGLSLAAASCGTGPAATFSAAPAGQATNSSQPPLTTTPSPPAGFVDGVYLGEGYKLIFAGGLFTLTTLVDQEWASGSFAVAGDQISFTEQDVEPECQPQDSRFTYGWAFNGEVLAFTPMNDPCSARQYFLPGTQWTYQARTPQR